MQNLRDLARGIYPPLLADLGLVAALQGRRRRSPPVPVTVRADGVGRYPQDDRGRGVLLLLEALQNTAKYAGASHAARISLQARRTADLRRVRRRGGLRPARQAAGGTGLRNMADRLAALGGRLDVRSAPGAGTVITGRIRAQVSEVAA